MSAWGLAGGGPLWEGATQVEPSWGGVRGVGSGATTRNGARCDRSRPRPVPVSHNIASSLLAEPSQRPGQHRQISPERQQARSAAERVAQAKFRVGPGRARRRLNNAAERTRTSTGCLAPLGPEPSASANFATAAYRAIDAASLGAAAGKSSGRRGEALRHGHGVRDRLAKTSATIQQDAACVDQQPEHHHHGEEPVLWHRTGH